MRTTNPFQIAVILFVLTLFTLPASAHNLGIFKTNFFATAAVSVGSTDNTELPLKPLAATNKLIVQPPKAVSLDRQSPIQFQVVIRKKYRLPVIIHRIIFRAKREPSLYIR